MWFYIICYEKGQIENEVKQKIDRRSRGAMNY